MQDILDKFPDVRVLVVGDVMLDKYLWGRAQRISPEAPVPVVNLERETFVAGGAANVAANIVGLGAGVRLLGVVGTDPHGEGFGIALSAKGVSADHLFLSHDRPTTIKTRIMANNQQIARIDREQTSELNSLEKEFVFKKFQDLIKETDVLILSDYAKGVLTGEFCTRLITTAKELGKKIIVDPKGENYQKYRGADVITPNWNEIQTASNFLFARSFSPEIAGTFFETLDLQALLVTKGEEGMTLYRKEFGTNPLDLPANTRNVFDVTGAGDTVIATLAVALQAGSDLAEAAKLANLAAGIVVEMVGTTVIKISELKSRLEKG